jgi:uncharacterized protein YbjT (DUF2867 family)
MRVLVTGGTGNIGSRVVHELLDLGVEVRVLTRDPERAKALPREAQAVRGDLMDPATIRSAFQDIDGLFLLNAVSVTESHEGLMAVIGASMAKIRRIAYLSVHRVDEAPHLPHFGSKVGIEAALRASGIPTTVLRPSSYFQTDLWVKDVILGYGVYPHPFGRVGVSRVDVRDIAKAAALALTSEEPGFRTLSLVGPEVLTGPQCAETWSRALGRPIAYAGDDLDAFEKQALQFLPPAIAFDIRMMYEHFRDHGLKGTPEEVERLTKFLGQPPRRYEPFVEETAKAWKAEASASDRSKAPDRAPGPQLSS